MANTSEQQQQAMVNRAIRSIRNELEYLHDLRILTPQQFSSILAQVPPPSTTNGVPPLGSSSLITPSPSPLPTNSIPTPSDPAAPQPAAAYQPPPSSSFNEKHQQPDFFAPSSAIPPPAYAPNPTPAPAPAVPSLATASALYEYKPSDAGDLALYTGDRIAITEFMNADWAKGRNERTGLEGIFPRSYVNILDEKSPPQQQQYGYNSGAGAYGVRPPTTPATGNGTSYGNLPMEVSQSGSGGGSNMNGQGGGKESKLGANGKKFGKKLGNATIFGAGATIGSNIVNGIL